MIQEKNFRETNNENQLFNELNCRFHRSSSPKIGQWYLNIALFFTHFMTLRPNISEIVIGEDGTLTLELKHDSTTEDARWFAYSTSDYFNNQIPIPWHVALAPKPSKKHSLARSFDIWPEWSFSVRESTGYRIRPVDKQLVLFERTNNPKRSHVDLVGLAEKLVESYLALTQQSIRTTTDPAYNRRLR